MILKGASQAREFAVRLAAIVTQRNIPGAMDAIEPIIHDKNPFRLLDLVGAGIADCPSASLLPFLDAIATTTAEGGWVVIAAALHFHQGKSLPFRLEMAQQYIIWSDIWYGADIFAERVPGPFLLEQFAQTLAQLKNWTKHSNPWVRRSVGVAVHFWTKRTRSDEKMQDQVHLLLDLLAPVFEEKDMRAAKGIGWGLKTLGRYYPQLVSDWLHEQLHIQGRQPMCVVRRKALTFLPNHLKQRMSK